MVQLTWKLWWWIDCGLTEGASGVNRGDRTRGGEGGTNTPTFHSNHCFIHIFVHPAIFFSPFQISAMAKFLHCLSSSSACSCFWSLLWLLLLLQWDTPSWLKKGCISCCFVRSARFPDQLNYWASHFLDCVLTIYILQHRPALFS